MYANDPTRFHSAYGQHRARIGRSPSRRNQPTIPAQERR